MQNYGARHIACTPYLTMEPINEETYLCTSLIWAAATALHSEPAALMTILMQLDVQPTCGHANQWVLQNNGGNGNSIPRSNFLLWDSLHFLQPLRAHGSIKGAILGNTHQTTPVFVTICFTAAHISSRLTDPSSDMPMVQVQLPALIGKSHPSESWSPLLWCHDLSTTLIFYYQSSLHPCKLLTHRHGPPIIIH